MATPEELSNTFINKLKTQIGELVARVGLVETHLEAAQAEIARRDAAEAAKKAKPGRAGKADDGEPNAA